MSEPAPPAAAGSASGAEAPAPAGAVRRGTRSRAGNTMTRTRAGLLDAARACLARQGARRTTMVDITAAAGIAKATVYNHFRDRTELWQALLVDETATLTRLLADAPDPAAALAAAAEHVAGSAAVSGLRAHDPGVLALVGAGHPAVAATRAAVLAALHDRGGQSLAAAGWPWLLGHLLDPGTHDSRLAGARLLAAPVGSTRTGTTGAAVARPPAPAGLGWPEQRAP